MPGKQDKSANRLNHTLSNNKIIHPSKIETLHLQRTLNHSITNKTSLIISQNRVNHLMISEIKCKIDLLMDKRNLIHGKYKLKTNQIYTISNQENK